MCKGAPAVLCGNKVDLEDRKVKPKHTTLKDNIIKCYDISAKDSFQIDDPFRSLCRKLVGDDELFFVED